MEDCSVQRLSYQLNYTWMPTCRRRLVDRGSLSTDPRGPFSASMPSTETRLEHHFRGPRLVPTPYNPEPSSPFSARTHSLTVSLPSTFYPEARTTPCVATFLDRYVILLFLTLLPTPNSTPIILNDRSPAYPQLRRPSSFSSSSSFFFLLSFQLARIFLSFFFNKDFSLVSQIYRRSSSIFDYRRVFSVGFLTSKRVLPLERVSGSCRWDSLSLEDFRRCLRDADEVSRTLFASWSERVQSSRSTNE